MMNIKKAVAYSALRNAIRRNNTLFYLTELASARRKPITLETRFVIEGFPRSGNSYALETFLHSNRDLVGAIGSHAHSPAQLVRAKRLGIPTLLLIREPVGAVTSYMTYQQAHGRRIGAREALTEYIKYHENVLRHCGYPVIADFSDIIDNIAPSILEINRKFGSNFTPYTPSADREKEVFDSVLARNDARGGDRKRASIPRGERNSDKARHQASIHQHPDLLSLAQARYDELRTRMQAHN